jgi:Zn-dependent protease/CBS domain-containing protein
VFGRRFELFRVFGFAIRIDASWFIVVTLVTWTLAQKVFPATLEDLAQGTYWTMGVFGALGLFASVIVHELAHALVARHYGLSMRGITLFIFGGVAEMSQEPSTPKAEFMVAVAGPLASVFIALLCFGLSLGEALFAWPAPVTRVLAYIAFLNLVLVAFNIVPAFPLDGGRVLRSLLWHWKNNLRWATRVSSAIGSGFGMFLIVVGVWRIVIGDFVGGLWSALIGMFLRFAAQTSYQQLLLRRVLEGEPVRRFMQRDPVTVPRALSVRELVEDYVYRYHFKMFPVVDDGRLVGCVTTRRLKELPQEEWARQSVGAVAEPCTVENTVSPDTDAMQALSKMNQTGASRLLVVDEERLVGIIALKDLLKFFSLKMELEERRV